MDFSNSAFRIPSSKVSNDTMSHSNLVMSCRWGWTSTEGAKTPVTSSSTPQPPSTSTFNNIRTKRFAPCQGRLYHQLLCSHRIRTDLVEDCGANCVEPYGTVIDTAFLCNQCIQGESEKIWQERQAQHNATYPPMEQMTQQQYDQWYTEHRQLEADFSRDQRAYELELQTKTRPSNICSALEASKEETEFATELDSLSLSMMTSNASITPEQNRSRVSLPFDASEQLHWDLNTLALDRGSCSIECSASSSSSAAQQSQNVSSARPLNAEELWMKPRN
ncbi:hypothetical protein BDW02DRAFT_40325 [Decorospora gaudefroyi]|uniref:Uncharacterized protein n=1 Tax=Decorospora gaudefroyi TaxID=184978 RepID=A0A6A5K1Y2_9PLEO|nr:hypothetical protein BDW02DRAFT_40325 [Decorospora gaudefroyi]